MKKILSSLFFVIMITVFPINALAQNYDAETPLINYTPIEPENSQYPIPVNSYQPQGYNNSQLKGSVVMVPASTTFIASVMTPLSSESAKVGDNVVFYLSSDFYYGKNLIAAQGSRLNGTVIKVKRGGAANRQGQLQIKFTNIVTPSGQMIPVSASILTDDGTGILKAGTAMDATKEYVKDVGIGAAIGAAFGTALGAISGDVGKGALYGTTLGGGSALVGSLFERGGNVEIPQSAQMNIILDQPITVSSNTPY